MRELGMVVIALAVGCGSSSSKSPDAAVAFHDAPVVHDAAPDGPPWVAGASMTHVLFLQMEGVTVTPGEDDATMDKSIIPMQSSPLKSWRMNDGSARAAELSALVTEIQGVVAPYNITVVATRPASGTYHEVIVTDDAPQAIGLSSGIAAITSAPSQCNTQAAHVSFVFPNIIGDTYSQGMSDFATNMAVAMFAAQGGVPQSTKTGDCMCFSSQSCGQFSGACTIGGAGTPVYAMQNCGDPDGTMNEGAVFLEAFGPHS